ncbi:DUF2130 domain-containing protein [Ureaplasma urealyticum]|uniref:DUF2130 domain-containing protein n=1 Tax=Ureaplasma urealyticum TaxID=2130 RepID=UPI0001793BB1|nr:DUF2130 domain-containing protein [Ureaplasma urealyticum]EDX53729.1 conserved hypothetical protein [Ureaplasma urealyticum serovar 9 str. ATCC 33175]QDI63732.1 DUF2130 domain-containing protein [Ureaplasma urealyticum]
MKTTANKKIKLINIEKLEFEILEPINTNEILVFKDENSTIYESFNQNLEKQRDEFIKKIREEEEQNWRNDFIANDRDYNELVKQRYEFEKQRDELKEKLKNEGDKAIAHFKDSDEYKSLIKAQEKINSLNKTIESNEQNYKKEIENIKLKLKNKFEEETESLKNTIIEQKSKLDNVERMAIVNFKESDEYQKIIKDKRDLDLEIEKLKLSIQNHEKDMENAKLKWNYQKTAEIKDLETKKNNEIDKLKESIEQLKREKSSNVKLVGEELEQWLKNKFDETYSFSCPDMAFTKINEVIDGKKADFLLEFFDKETSNDDKKLIFSATIEAKTEFYDNQKGTKNSVHYKKLNQDRINQKSEYAILVTELEPDDHFVIKKINEYENMFAVRPQYFIPLVDMIRNFATLKARINSQIIKYEDRAKIETNLEELKKDIIDNTLQYINDKTKKIIDDSKAIIKKAESIEETAGDIINKKLNTLKKKINGLTIRKIDPNKLLLKFNDDENDEE